MSPKQTKTNKQQLLCAFVLSRLAYCNSFLAGCPKYLRSKLQSVQNNAARLIFRTTRSAHVTPMLHSLSHYIFSDDNQLYRSGNVSQLPEIIHSTQSCISDVKAWTTNNQLRLNNDKTEMIPIASKTILNSDCSTVHKSGGF